jgi:predicted transcriptional regulator
LELTMTLTVRLDETLELALERYCLSTGATKSGVVQEALAAHLMDRPAARGAAPARQRSISNHFQAFVDAGLVGAVALGAPQLGGVGGTAGANKAAVRARVAARFSETADSRPARVTVVASQNKRSRKASP